MEDFPLCPPGGAVEAALLAVLRLPDPPHRAVRLQAMGEGTQRHRRGSNGALLGLRGGNGGG